MTKDEFLRLLDRKLDVINERERRDIIDEYRTHIEILYIRTFDFFSSPRR